ncbi:D-amino acid dehydrogenase [Paraburkholderia caballeronis]|uniref:D-amino acid dehydrogenase small subunit n=1 Tax=Paraburkholderia caballeronis TaxID=416943 RepID=A0A1H7LG66_9BURK|nr:D-amino acid dehydrogenase [Paraburkholderia caballeronis]PXW28448.1 D-amino acid dehydrogenase small subunit [Paraburkholderia caballeronis]PXX03814.1 D-amino acid dehydrogenase small subunit [Paraburkholderia caballeronis]RAK04558.1 D-amino acid dehydrogenase small subunit [Paraburkholderia caballeronis]TDV19467.1 D-amino acid dehydrogenase small subunit [Paraburkholderia caballeronis]TDV22067.1 D-amino acid dehydrogenase small subunit [Paraburkholderia caballeronis]
MRILIVGAGVIGLSSAYCLNRAGHDVTVVDRHADVAAETSFGNGGQLSYSYVAPLAGPGVVSKLPGWLVRGDAPVRFRPRLDARQWRWCIAFLRACTRRRSDLTTRELLSLSFLSRTLMHELIAAEPQLDFDFTRSGKLVLHRDAAAMHGALRQLEFQRTLGCEQYALDADACVALEPALADVRPQLAGGIHTPGEDTADCRRFCAGLEGLLRARGVRFVMETGIDRLNVSADGHVFALHDGAPLDADHLVVASGAACASLLKPLGIHVPVYPLKGYSLTFDLQPGVRAPHVSVTDFGRKVVYARLGSRLRVAGIADLEGDSLAPDPRRIATLRAETAALFPDVGSGAAVEWTGLRPATPRGTPIVGPTRFRNLWLNVGHGALGFTLAMGAAALLAERLAGGRHSALHDTFAPAG